MVSQWGSAFIITAKAGSRTRRYCVVSEVDDAILDDIRSRYGMGVVLEMNEQLIQRRGNTYFRSMLMHMNFADRGIDVRWVRYGNALGDDVIHLPLSEVLRVKPGWVDNR